MRVRRSQRWHTRQRDRWLRFRTGLLLKMFRTGTTVPGPGLSINPPPWHRTSRPSAKPVAPPRNSFPSKSPAKKVKKIARPLELRRPFPRPTAVGAVIPPHRGCIRRERPSTPSAPYGFTRPVVPPDGAFVLAGILAHPLDEIRCRAPRLALFQRSAIPPCP